MRATVELVHVTATVTTGRFVYSERVSTPASHYDKDTCLFVRDHMIQTASAKVRKLVRSHDPDAPADLPVEITTSREMLELEPAEGVEDDV